MAQKSYDEKLEEILKKKAQLEAQLRKENPKMRERREPED